VTRSSLPCWVSAENVVHGSRTKSSEISQRGGTPSHLKDSFLFHGRTKLDRVRSTSPGLPLLFFDSAAFGARRKGKIKSE
jgi:hypothetical protein